METQQKNNQAQAQSQKPKFAPLRKDLQLFSVGKNGNEWVLFDPVADKYYAVGEKEHTILSIFNKASTVDELYEKVKKLDSSITEQDILKLISFLYRSQLLEMPVSMNKKKPSIFSILAHYYMFIKIPLWDPDKFITKTYPIVSAVFDKWVILIFASMSVFGYISLVRYWDKFEHAIIDSLTYTGLIKYLITIAILKVFHEMAHAYTAKRLGIRIRKFGISFIFFLPRLYTDITDSWRVNNRKDKLLIDLAGILSELTIGGIAILFWIYMGPGIIKTISYYIFAISILNTALINGNPFIRYDGYYVLSDLTGIDNLMMKGRVLLSNMIKKVFFGIEAENMWKIKGSTKLLLILYSIGSFLYRFFLYTGIVLLVYYRFTKILGIILASIEICYFIYMPVYREIKSIFILKSRAQKGHSVITLSILFILLVVFIIPLPWTESFPCIVGSTKDVILYINEPGYIDKIVAKHGSIVKKNDLILELYNNSIVLSGKKLNYQLAQKREDLNQMLVNNRIKNKHKSYTSIKSKLQRIKDIENKLKENISRQKKLRIISPIEGYFVLFDWHMQPGKWLGKGQAIGEIFSPNNIVVYGYCEEKDIKNISPGDKVTILFNGDLHKYKGYISETSLVPTKVWGPSPLLNIFRGPIQILKKKSQGLYILKKYQYQIVVIPEKNNKNKLHFGRTGEIHIRKFSSIGLSIIRRVVNFFIKEIAF